MSPDVTRQSTLATSPPPIPPSGENDGLADSGLAPEGVPVSDNGITNDLVELLFFAYRDFVGDPDRMLAEYGFGRAHHRVLHFVYHYPGLTIAELLDILRITKQSLNRVLKDLIEQGHIVQKTGRSDRRQRLLYCSETGAHPHGRADAGAGTAGRPRHRGPGGGWSEGRPGQERICSGTGVSHGDDRTRRARGGDEPDGAARPEPSLTWHHRN